MLDLQHLNIMPQTVETEIKSEKALTESPGSWEPDGGRPINGPLRVQ